MENRTSIHTIFCKEKSDQIRRLPCKSFHVKKGPQHENTHFPFVIIHPREFGADFVMVVVVMVPNISTLKILQDTLSLTWFQISVVP
jgi:hypothetical protein